MQYCTQIDIKHDQLPSTLKQPMNVPSHASLPDPTINTAVTVAEILHPSTPQTMLLIKMLLKLTLPHFIILGQPLPILQ
jgi:hypothetical protein